MAPLRSSITTRNLHPQSSAMFDATSSSIGSKQQKRLENKVKLRKLAFAELVLGILSIVLGAVIAGLALSPKPYYHYVDPYYMMNFGYPYPGAIYPHSSFATGEGVWCGIWVVIAGILGFRSSKPMASKCMMICHLVFSVIAAMFSLAMCVIALFGAIRNVGAVAVVVLYSVLCGSALLLIILLVLTAIYSSAALTCNKKDLRGCCDGIRDFCCCCTPYSGYSAAPVLYTQPPVVRDAAYSYPTDLPKQNVQVVYAHQPNTLGVPNLQQGCIQAVVPTMHSNVPPSYRETAPDTEE